LTHFVFAVTSKEESGCKSTETFGGGGKLSGRPRSLVSEVWGKAALAMSMPTLSALKMRVI
jgi:hypothetical protein